MSVIKSVSVLKFWKETWSVCLSRILLIILVGCVWRAKHHFSVAMLICCRICDEFSNSRALCKVFQCTCRSLSQVGISSLLVGKLLIFRFCCWLIVLIRDGILVGIGRLLLYAYLTWRIVCPISFKAWWSCVAFCEWVWWKFWNLIFLLGIILRAAEIILVWILY